MRRLKNVLVRGVTVFDLLISLAICSCLIFFLMPLGSHFIRRNALDERVNTLKSAIKYSQNQALLKGKKLILAPLSSKIGWSSGMQLATFNEPVSNKKTILRQWHWHNGERVNITWRGFNTEQSLVFSNDLMSSSLSGSFLLKQSKQLKRKLIINRLGRIRIEHVT